MKNVTLMMFTYLVMASSYSYQMKVENYTFNPIQIIDCGGATVVDLGGNSNNVECHPGLILNHSDPDSDHDLYFKGYENSQDYHNVQLAVMYPSGQSQSCWVGNDESKKPQCDYDTRSKYDHNIHVYKLLGPGTAKSGVLLEANSALMMGNKMVLPVLTNVNVFINQAVFY